MNTELPGREGTYVVWVKGHKDIKGNEEADRISRETSILWHETEEVVTSGEATGHGPVA